MSKKLEALKNAVFYAHEKPEVLAWHIAGLITDVATSVSISGAASITIPSTGSATEAYTASVLSQFGDVMTGTPTIAIDGDAPDGVSLSGGTLTVASTASEGSVTLKATSGSLTSTRTVALVSG